MKEKCFHCDEKLPYEMDTCPKCGYSENRGLPAHAKVWKIGLAVVGVLVVLSITSMLLQSKGCKEAVQGLGERAAEETMKAQAKIECEAHLLEWNIEYRGFFDYTVVGKVRLQNKASRSIRAVVAMEVVNTAGEVTLAKSYYFDLTPLETKDVEFPIDEAEESKKSEYNTARAKVVQVGDPQ